MKANFDVNIQLANTLCQKQNQSHFETLVGQSNCFRKYTQHGCQDWRVFMENSCKHAYVTRTHLAQTYHDHEGQACLNCRRARPSSPAQDTANGRPSGLGF